MLPLFEVFDFQHTFICKSCFNLFFEFSFLKYSILASQMDYLIAPLILKVILFSDRNNFFFLHPSQLFHFFFCLNLLSLSLFLMLETFLRCQVIQGCLLVIKDEGMKFCSDALKVQLKPVVLDPHYGVIWMSYLKGNTQMLVFLDFCCCCFGLVFFFLR